MPADAYRSVGLSSQRGTFIFLDDAKKPLGNSIVWNCGRALKYQEIFSKEISPADHQDHTGMQLSPLWSAAKIAWLRDNEPAMFEKTRWFANGQEYFLYQARRRGMGDRSGLADPQRHDGDPQARLERPHPRIVRVSIATVLPPVGIPSGKAGKLSKAAAEATGLPEGIALCRGAGDQQCAAIGAGVIKQGMAEFTVGTSGVMVAHLDSLDRIKGRNLWWGGHGVPGAWDIEGAAFSLGACLKWWRNNLGRDETEMGSLRGTQPLLDHGRGIGEIAGRRQGIDLSFLPDEPGDALLRRRIARRISGPWPLSRPAGFDPRIARRLRQ